MARLYLTGRHVVVGDYPEDMEKIRGRTFGLFSSQMMDSAQKSEPMLPFCLHLSAGDPRAALEQGMPGDWPVDVGFPAGAPGNGYILPEVDGAPAEPHYSGNSAPAIPQVSCIVEYGFGTTTNVLECDWRPGVYQFPPSEFARVSVRFRNPMKSESSNGLGLQGVTFNASVLPGTTASPHPLTFTVPLRMYGETGGDGAVVFGSYVVPVPVKARAVEVTCPAPVLDIEATTHVLSLVRVAGARFTMLRRFEYPTAQVMEPPFSPVPVDSGGFLSIYAETRRGLANVPLYALARFNLSP